jgi:membrane protein
VNRLKKFFRRLSARLKQAIDHLKARFEPVYERYLAKPAVNLIVRIVNQIGNTNATALVGNVAYNVILSLFPLLLGLLAILGYFLPSETLQSQIIQFFQTIMPSSVDVLQTNFTRIINARATLGFLGTLGMLWTGTSIVSTLDDAVNRAWGVTTFRPFWIAKPLELGLAIGFGLLMLISLGASFLLSFESRFSLPFTGFFIQIVGYILAFLLILVTLLVMYKLFPNKKTTWRGVLPGALLGAVLFEIARQLFFFYAGSLAQYEIIYGALATIIFFIIWIYYVAFIIILGAIFSSELQRLRQELHDDRYTVVKPGQQTPPGQ